MIEVHYSGRLGSWLFQYCLGRLAAERSGLRLQAQPIAGIPGSSDVIEGVQWFAPTFSWEGDAILETPSMRRIPPAEALRPQEGRIELRGTFRRAEYFEPARRTIIDMLRLPAVDLRPEGELLICLCSEEAGADRNALLSEREIRSLAALRAWKRIALLVSSPAAVPAALASELGAEVLCEAPLRRLHEARRFRHIALSQCSLLWWAAFLSDAEIFFPPAGRGPWASSEGRRFPDGMSGTGSVSLALKSDRCVFDWMNPSGR